MIADERPMWAEGLVRFSQSMRLIGQDQTHKRLREFGEAWRRLRPYQEVQPSRAVERLSVERLSVAGPALAEAMSIVRGRGDAFNPWTTARLKHDEVRNAAVLAAFMTPGQVGETGPQFLNAILRRIDDGSRAFPDLVALQRGYRVRTEDCPLGEASERVDLTIEGDGFLIGIEVKINAPEGPDQFNRYRRTIERRAADGGRSPHVIILARKRLNVAGLSAASWGDVAAAARNIASNEPNSPINHMLRAFAAHVRNF